MNFPSSESISYTVSYHFSTYGHQQEVQKQLGQRETAKQQPLLHSDFWEETPDAICKVKTTKLANLALWEFWTKSHSLGPHLLELATLWCSRRQKMEANNSVLTVMKSSEDKMSAWAGCKKSNRRSLRGREMPSVTGDAAGLQNKIWNTQASPSHRSLYESHKCIKWNHCIAHRGLITKWLIRYSCKTTQKTIIFEVSQSTLLCGKHNQVHRPDGRPKSQPHKQHWC